jgi:hypothetical protein
MRPEPKSPAVIRSLNSMWLLGLAVSAASCSLTTRWDTKFVTNFAPSGHTVSVFGVYKDGQMSSEAWDALRPRVEPLLGGRACEIASSTPVSDSPLSSAIDDYTRTNGPTENLLAQLAPAAQGDLILTLVEAGSLSAPEKVSVVNSSSAPSAPSPTGNSGKSGLPTYAPDKRSAPGRDVLQLSAELFSVAQGRSVAVIDMQYSGDSVDEAERQFAARVAQLFPAITCKGWDWSAKVDPDRIRALAD